MSYQTTFASTPVSRLSLSIPYTGLWTAGVTMTTDATLPKTATLQHGNLSLTGSVYRQATRWGQTQALLVGGFGGWSGMLAKRGYSLPFGVLLSTVLGDAALELGEQVAVAADTAVGAYYTRPAMTGGELLRQAAGTAWYVDPASGVVQVGPRTSPAIQSRFDALEWDAASGVVTVATDDAASWQPGATFANTLVQQQTISSVRHYVKENGAARMRVMVGSGDRILDATRALIKQETPTIAFDGVYKYTVTAATPFGLDVTPTSGNIPAIQRVPAGNVGPLTLATLVGSNVLVQFENGDPSKPFVPFLSIPLTALTDVGAMVTGFGPVTYANPAGAIVVPLVAP